MAWPLVRSFSARVARVPQRTTGVHSVCFCPRKTRLVAMEKEAFCLPVGVRAKRGSLPRLPVMMRVLRDMACSLGSAAPCGSTRTSDEAPQARVRFRRGAPARRETRKQRTRRRRARGKRSQGRTRWQNRSILAIAHPMTGMTVMGLSPIDLRLPRDLMRCPRACQGSALPQCFCLGSRNRFPEERRKVRQHHGRSEFKEAADGPASVAMDEFLRDTIRGP